MPVELQPSLLKETGALVIDTGAPVCLFELSGKPRGKGDRDHRIAYTKDGRPFAQFYLDEATQDYMRALAWAAKGAMKGRPPTSKPLALTLHAFMPVYKSWTARERSDALIHALRPTEKPDWDNMGKIMDALTGIVWKDDAPIVEAHVYKFYSDDPALRVEVREFVPPK